MALVRPISHGQEGAVNRFRYRFRSHRSVAPNGELVSDGTFTYAYDALSRLIAAYSNGTFVVSNRYDHLGRRVVKIAADGTHTFLYDGWRPLVETIVRPDSTTDRIDYVWGKDISGRLDGAAGIGGLLYVKLNGAIFVPFCDAYGNVMGYRDSNGAIVAEYTYDAFGQTVAQNGTMADVFTIRYSTKYYDKETGLYYYGKRHYSPVWRRWLTRDPIGEEGGANLYLPCNNCMVQYFDPLGMDRYMTQFDIGGVFGSGGTQLHIGVAVDTWKCKGGKWVKTGIATFNYGVDSSRLIDRVKAVFAVAKGGISEDSGLTLKNSFTIPSTPEQDVEMLRLIRKDVQNPSLYNLFFNDCIHWATKAIDYGMDK